MVRSGDTWVTDTNHDHETAWEWQWQWHGEVGQGLAREADICQPSLKLTPGQSVPVTRVHSMRELTIRAGSSPLKVFPCRVLSENYLLSFLRKFFPSLFLFQ